MASTLLAPSGARTPFFSRRPARAPALASTARDVEVERTAGRRRTRCGVRSAEALPGSVLRRGSNDVLPPDFLCPLSANVYGIDFLSFRIRDYDSNTSLFEVSKDPSSPAVRRRRALTNPIFFYLTHLAARAPTPAQEMEAMMEELDDSYRCIRYDFDKQFLRLKTVGTTYVLAVPARHVRARAPPLL